MKKERFECLNARLGFDFSEDLQADSLSCAIVELCSPADFIGRIERAVNGSVVGIEGFFERGGFCSWEEYDDYKELWGEYAPDSYFLPLNKLFMDSCQNDVTASKEDFMHHLVHLYGEFLRCKPRHLKSIVEMLFRPQICLYASRVLAQAALPETANFLIDSIGVNAKLDGKSIPYLIDAVMESRSPLSPCFIDIIRQKYGDEIDIESMIRIYGN